MALAGVVFSTIHLRVHQSLLVNEIFLSLFECILNCNFIFPSPSLCFLYLHAMLAI